MLNGTFRYANCNIAAGRVCGRCFGLLDYIYYQWWKCRNCNRWYQV